MNRATAEKLCPDIAWIRTKDKKLQCRHKQDDLCDHPGHFVCELVLFKQRSAAKKEGEGRAPISSASIAIFDQCMRKYAFIYEHKIPTGSLPLKQIEKNEFLTARAKIDTRLPWGIPDDLPKTSYHKLMASLRFYEDHPPYPTLRVACEIETTFMRHGEQFQEYLDARSIDFTTAYTWSYAAQPADRLGAVRHAAVYFCRFGDLKRFEFITFAKPTHKPKKAAKATKRTPDPQPESLDDFEERVYQSLVEKGPKNVYHRVVIRRNDAMAANVLDQMEAKHKMIDAARQADWPASYSACRECDFSRLCTDYLGKPTSEIVQLMKEER